MLDLDHSLNETRLYKVEKNGYIKKAQKELHSLFGIKSREGFCVWVLLFSLLLRVPVVLNPTYMYIFLAYN